MKIGKVASIRFKAVNGKNLINNPNNDFKNIISKQNLKKVSPDTLKANYLINFKGDISNETTSDGRWLLHQTHFFKEPETDEIVQNYIRYEFEDEPEINIVSGACSSGEEAKSYAMMLDDLGEKVNISGFDISEYSVEKAKKSKVSLIIEAQGADALIPCDMEKFLTDDNTEGLTEYQKRCREKFKEYYIEDGKPYTEPTFPEVVKKLEEKKKLLRDCKNPLDRLFLEGDIERCEADAKKMCTYQDFEAKEGSFKNCSFKKGDVLDLEKLYDSKKSSINVLLYRYALYHTLRDLDKGYRALLPNAKQIMGKIARQMNKVVKQDGLVVFGELEPDEIVEREMQKNGFRKLVYKNKEINNVWVKERNV